MLFLQPRCNSFATETCNYMWMYCWQFSLLYLKGIKKLNVGTVDRWLTETKSIQGKRKHGSEGRRRGAFIPLVPRKTFHLRIITCFLLRAIAAWIGNKKTHITRRENYWKDTIVSNSSCLCHVTKRLSEYLFTLCSNDMWKY